jgi:hypothetical protein
MSDLISVFTLVERGMQKAFDNESQAELNQVKMFLKETQEFMAKFGGSLLPRLPSLEWKLNLGVCPDWARPKMTANRFEIILRETQQIVVCPHGWENYIWEVRGRNSDIMAWKFVGV